MLTPKIDMFTITPNLTIPKREELEKQFDWVSSLFTDDKEWRYYDNQPRNSNKKECLLFQVNEKLSTKEIIEKMKAEGLEPASFQELLAFTDKYPDERKKYPIVALGSVCRYDGRLYSPYVGWCDDERLLNFGWLDNDWNDSYRFLAVRKQPLNTQTLNPSALSNLEKRVDRLEKALINVGLNLKEDV